MRIKDVGDCIVNFLYGFTHTLALKNINITANIWYNIKILTWYDVMRLDFKFNQMLIKIII